MDRYGKCRPHQFHHHHEGDSPQWGCGYEAKEGGRERKGVRSMADGDCIDDCEHEDAMTDIEEERVCQAVRPERGEDDRIGEECHIHDAARRDERTAAWTRKVKQSGDAPCRA